MNTGVLLKIFFSALLASSLVVSLHPTFVSASPRLRFPGVKVGDWAKYGNITVTWSSNDPNRPKPDKGLIIANETAWFSHTVTKIEDTIITFRNITHFKDDMQTTNTLWVDVNEGWGNLTTPAFISAGLNPGDTMYETIDPEEPRAYINSTQLITYLGVTRQTHNLNLTWSDRVETDPPQIIQLSVSYYWDAITGILTERRASHVNKTGDYVTSSFTSDIIVDTNLWFPDTISPKADAGNDQTVYQNDVVKFDGSLSKDNVDIVSYEWDFGDGTKDTGVTTTHVYTEPGTYNVTLTVKDAVHLKDTDWITVIVKEATAEGFPFLIPGVAIVTLFGVLVLYQRTRSKRRKRRKRRPHHRTLHAKTHVNSSHARARSKDSLLRTFRLRTFFPNALEH